MVLRIVLLILIMLPVPALATERLLVFAAASQRDALIEIGKLYEEICSCKVTYSFAATSTLARQIDAGAKVDAFISANQAWVDWLEIRARIDANTRSVIAGNRLVIASAAVTKDSFNILWRGKFAMADPVSVPAGIYAREAMETMGIWDKSRKNVVFSENVRVALSSVKRGDLLSGIVYQSDLKLVPELHAHYLFPENTHSPIHYVAASVKDNGKGTHFISFLKSKDAQTIFARFGFLPPSVTN